MVLAPIAEVAQSYGPSTARRSPADDINYTYSSACFVLLRKSALLKAMYFGLSCSALCMSLESVTSCGKKEENQSSWFTRITYCARHGNPYDCRIISRVIGKYRPVIIVFVFTAEKVPLQMQQAKPEGN